MKLLRLVKLGHRNITHHKKQTILTVIVIGSLFGVLIATQMIIQGVEDVFLKQFDWIFPGKTYIVAHGCSNREIKDFESNNSCLDELNNQEPDDGESLQICLIELNKKPFACGNDTNKINQLFNEKAKKYGGKVVGNVKHLTAGSSDTPIPLYPEGIFKHLITDDASHKPQDALTAMVSFENAARLAGLEYGNYLNNTSKLDLIKDVHEKALGKTFEYSEHKIFVAGILPYGWANPKLAKHERDFRPIDIFIGNVSIDNSSAIFYLDDNSEALQKILKDSTVKFQQVIIKFDDGRQVYEFYKHQMHRPDLALISEFEPKTPEYNITELITGKIGTMYNFKISRFLLSFVNYMLLITAVIIIVFTFI